MGLFTSHHGKNDFAGVVASALTRQTEDASINAGMEDTFTLSYEDALRKHARRPLAEELAQITEMAAAELDARRAAAAPAPTEEEAPLSVPVTKAASITLRMSKEESALLRKRAAVAGISVSAYIRSCIFEAEELRTQVKNALAELKLARVVRHG